MNTAERNYHWEPGWYLLFFSFFFSFFLGGGLVFAVVADVVCCCRLLSLLLHIKTYIYIKEAALRQTSVQITQRPVTLTKRRTTYLRVSFCFPCHLLSVEKRMNLSLPVSSAGRSAPTQEQFTPAEQRESNLLLTARHPARCPCSLYSKTCPPAVSQTSTL